VKSPGFFKLYLFSLNREHACPGQDNSDRHAGPPKGPLLLFVHWFNEGCCVEGGEIGEEVRSMGNLPWEK
jgi:hypothetical protein